MHSKRWCKQLYTRPRVIHKSYFAFHFYTLIRAKHNISSFIRTFSFPARVIQTINTQNERKKMLKTCRVHPEAFLEMETTLSRCVCFSSSLKFHPGLSLLLAEESTSRNWSPFCTLFASVHLSLLRFCLKNPLEIFLRGT